MWNTMTKRFNKDSSIKPDRHGCLVHSAKETKHTMRNSRSNNIQQSRASYFYTIHTHICSWTQAPAWAEKRKYIYFKYTVYGMLVCGKIVTSCRVILPLSTSHPTDNLLIFNMQFSWLAMSEWVKLSFWTFYAVKYCCLFAFSLSPFFHAQQRKINI